jgi:hypothetical protein
VGIGKCNDKINSKLKFSFSQHLFFKHLRAHVHLNG